MLEGGQAINETGTAAVDEEGVCVMDRTGKKLVHTNIKNNDFAFFLKLVAPYRHDLTVCAECMFGWYWLADACHDAKLTFVLAHALYLKAIHGGKNKNDHIDSEKLTHLLRSNLIPPAYVYPADKHPLRALLRQRLNFVWQRTELQSRIQAQQLAYNRPTPTSSNRDHWEAALREADPDPLRQLALQNNLALTGAQAKTQRRKEYSTTDGHGWTRIYRSKRGNIQHSTSND